MSLTLTRAQVRLFHALSEDDQRATIEAMAPGEQLLLDALFEMWADDGQHMPGGEGWRVWLMLAGRGFGKTRAGAEWVNQLAAKRGIRIALVAASIDEARSIMVEGASGILSVARSRHVKIKWEPSLKRLTWPSCIRAIMPIACVDRNIILRGATSLRNGARQRRHGPICRWDCALVRDRGRW